MALLFQVAKLAESIKRYSDAEVTTLEKIETCGSFFEKKEKEMFDSCSQLSVEDLKAELSSVIVKREKCRNICLLMKIIFLQVQKELANNSEEVNQKAISDYEFIEEKLKEHSDKLNALISHHEECTELVGNVDDHKNEALQYSLNQVAASFRTIFRTIVPRPAKGFMKWVYDDCDSDSEDEEDDGEPKVTIYFLFLDC